MKSQKTIVHAILVANLAASFLTSAKCYALDGVETSVESTVMSSSEGSDEDGLGLTVVTSLTLVLTALLKDSPDAVGLDPQVLETECLAWYVTGTVGPVMESAIAILREAGVAVGSAEEILEKWLNDALSR